MEEKIIIVPKARPAVDFASNLLVISKDDFDKYVNEIDAHHVKLIRSLESSWNIMADGRAVEAMKMAKEKYEEIIAKKDKLIEELKKKLTEEERTKKIPEPKTRRATWEQLAYWLIDGKGLVLDAYTNRVDTGVFFDMKNMHEEVGERWMVMKRGDSEWNEPTVDYMELEEK